MAVLGFLGLCFGAKAQNADSAPPAQAELAVSDKDAKSTSSGLPIPRFVSLAKDEVVVRTGPGLKYPMKWIYKRKALPVEVIQEFDTWRKIRDVDGDDGWVHQSLLSGKRSVLIKGEAGASLRKENETESNVLAVFEPNVVALVEQCAKEWCEVSSGGYNGWVSRKFLWGIYDAEDFD